MIQAVRGAFVSRTDCKSINRARMRAYEVLGTERRKANGRPLQEPCRAAEIPN